MTKLPAATYSVSLLTSLALSLPLSGIGAIAAQADTSGSTRPAVEVNLNALNYSGPQLKMPTRIIDGNSVIVLTPPSLQKKSPAPIEKIVKPLVKPSLTLPETTVTAAAAPVPVPPVNPAKLPKPAADAKFEDVATPVVKMDTAPIPTPEVIKETKEDVADIAAEKVTETTAVPAGSSDPKPLEVVAPAPTETTAPPASDVAEAGTKPEAEEEIKIAAIAPDAGPPAAAAAANLNENLTRILFTKGNTDLPKEAQVTLQMIADQVKQGDRQNVQLLAYGSGNSVSAARRLSLGRALAVRSKLMELGVENRQIEVRALGQPDSGGPSDRVDLLMISR